MFNLFILFSVFVLFSFAYAEYNTSDIQRDLMKKIDVPEKMIPKIIISGGLSLEECKVYIQMKLGKNKCFDDTTFFMSYKSGSMTLSHYVENSLLWYISKFEPLWCLEYIFNEYVGCGMHMKSVNRSEVGHGWVPNCDIFFPDGSVHTEGPLAVVCDSWKKHNPDQYKKWLSLVKKVNTPLKLKYKYHHSK